MKSIIRAIGFALLCAACGSNGASGVGTASGTINGVTLNIQDVVFGRRTSSTGAGALGIYLGDNIAGICALIGADAQPSGTYGVLELGTVNIAGEVTPGVYTISASGALVGVALYKTTAGDEYLASSGSITIDSVSASTATGSYSVTLATPGGSNVGSVSGTFNASYCAAAFQY